MAPTFSVRKRSSCAKSMAPRVHASAHFPQTAFLIPLRMPMNRAHRSRSSTGRFGTACGKGTEIAGRFPRPHSNSLGTLRLGQARVQAPQPLHRSSSTERALRRMVTSKLPM